MNEEDRIVGTVVPMAYFSGHWTQKESDSSISFKNRSDAIGFMECLRPSCNAYMIGPPVVCGVSGAVSWDSSDLAGADLVEQEEQENSY